MSTTSGNLPSNASDSNASVFSKYIQPIQDFQHTLDKFQKTFTAANNNIRLDQVVASLDAFKSAIYNVNYLTSLVNTNSREIMVAGEYASVLKPFIEKQYYNKDENFWDENFWIHNLSSRDLCYVYINNKYPFWNNLSLNEIIDYNSKNNLSQLSSIIGNDTVLNYANELKIKYPKNTSHYYFSVLPWENSLSLKINYFLPDLLNNNNILSIGSRVLLSDYISNTNDLTTFSPEYLKFINDLASEIAILNGNDWQADAIWPYSDPSKFDTLNCLYSSQYPEWTGKPISKCFIPGSTIDIPTTIYAIMVDLFFNYPSLKPGQIALSTYNLEDVYYVALLKIDMHNGELCFKQKSIEINKYFAGTSLSITNDVTINGSLNVKTYDGEDVIKTNNVTKTTAFHSKIGVNQDLSKVKGLIDVDNLSNNTVLNMMNDFVDPLLYSYQVTMDIKDAVTYGSTSVSIPLTYQEDVFVFKTPIQNVIQTTDISFLYVPSANTKVFSNKIFETTSFKKIQTIVNELNKMSPEMDLNTDTKAFLFSFVELLSDTNNNYLCSLRGVVKRNPNNLTKEIYFICSFLNVNDKIINKNQKPYMIALTDKFSSCCRLSNYSNLLVLDPQIQENLFKGQSISNSTYPYSPYFSDRINNSPFFRDRFGGKNLYSFCFEYLTNDQLVDANSNIELLSEEFPYFNNKQSNILFLPNTDISIFSIEKLIMNEYNNLYGSDKEIMTFFINYDWESGEKISFLNIVMLNGKKYLLGCGINLSHVLDETIIAKGDNKITGNLIVMDDSTNVPVFSVNREKKQTSSVYMTGIGKTNPQTMLDINDCGVTDVINMINKMARTYNLLNYNMQGLINALTQSEESAVQYIKNSFIDPSTGSQLVQDINSYIFFNLNNISYTVLYNWLYPNWTNNNIGEMMVNNKNDKQMLSVAGDGATARLNNRFNLCNIINVWKWVAGVKLGINKALYVNNKVYGIGIGVNLQQYVTYESNINIQKFIDCILSYSYQLQDIVIRYNSIPSSQIMNQEKASDVRYQYALQYPIQKLVQYTIDFNDIKSMGISDFDYNTLTATNTQVYRDITNSSLITKLMFLFINLKSQYTTIHKEDYGVISFEDDYNDFVSLFWCSAVSGNTVTLISLELQINSIIIPSLQLKGDMKIQGDAYFTNRTGSNNEDIYALIDTDKQFLGINTVQTVSNYANSYSTTTNGSFAKNNVYITSRTFPNTIIERISETNTPSDENYYRFKNFSTLSARRNSNLYTFEEIYNYSKQYTTTNAPGLINCYGTQTNKYHYGSDITYEIQDITNVVKEIGNTHIVIENIEKNSDGSTTLRAGFGVSVVDTITDEYTQEREILHVDNNSRLSVNSIMLGGKLLQVDASGNLLFVEKKVSLS